MLSEFIKQEIHSHCNYLNINLKTHFRCQHEGKNEILLCVAFMTLYFLLFGQTASTSPCYQTAHLLVAARFVSYMHVLLF